MTTETGGDGVNNGQSSDNAGAPSETYSMQLHHDPVSARVPERVGQGVFSTGIIVLEAPDEFVIDFVQGMARPPRIGARVIVSQRVMVQFVAALRENLQKFEASFGPPKELPRPPADRRQPNIQDIYKDLKMPDDLLSGVYATTIMISHSPGEFLFDFITRFFPNAAVSARVYISASQAPKVLETLSKSIQNQLNRSRQEPPQPPQPPSET